MEEASYGRGMLGGQGLDARNELVDKIARRLIEMCSNLHSTMATHCAVSGD